MDAVAEAQCKKPRTILMMQGFGLKQSGF